MKIGICNRNLWKEYLAVLGVIGIFTSFITIFISIKDEYKTCTGMAFSVFLLLIFLYLLYRANNMRATKFKINQLQIDICYGDIFAAQGLKLIPFNEYFDTLVDNIVISEKSLNGRLIKQLYPNVEILDDLISNALRGKQCETNANRVMGKKEKYPLGSIIEIPDNYILAAFTHFDNENRAYLSKADYLMCLHNLWHGINTIYAQRNITIPLLGSGISRIGNDMKLQDYLEQILNSIKLSNIDMAHNVKLSIVLHESVKDEINLYEITNRFK